LLAELNQISSWKDWVQVAQAYSFLHGKANSPRMLFNFWNNKIMRTNLNQSYRTQRAEIQEQIRNKAKSLGYTSINICRLIDGLRNIDDHQKASHAPDDDITTTAKLDEAGNLAAVNQQRDEGGNEEVHETAAVTFKEWENSNAPVRSLSMSTQFFGPSHGLSNSGVGNACH
jgi:hypothetical protein